MDSQWVSEPRVSCSALTGLYEELGSRKPRSFVLSSICSPPSHCSDVNFWHFPSGNLYTVTCRPSIVLVFVWSHTNSPLPSVDEIINLGPLKIVHGRRAQMKIFSWYLSILSAESPVLMRSTLCTSFQTHLDKSVKQESLKACNFPGNMGHIPLVMEESCKATGSRAKLSIYLI